MNWLQCEFKSWNAKYSVQLETNRCIVRGREKMGLKFGFESLTLAKDYQIERANWLVSPDCIRKSEANDKFISASRLFRLVSGVFLSFKIETNKKAFFNENV